MKTRLIRTQIKTKKGAIIDGYREELVDTEKNLSYVQKRKELADKATAELGVTTFG